MREWRTGLRHGLGIALTAMAALFGRLRAWTGRIRRLEIDSAATKFQLDALSARMRRIEDRERPSVPRPGAMSLNLTTKALALKLSHAGQDAGQIASSLGLPVGEIELLLKVQFLQERVAMRRRARELEREGLPGGVPEKHPAGTGLFAAEQHAAGELVN